MQDEDPQYWVLLTKNDIKSAGIVLENLMVLLKDFNQDLQPDTSIQYLLKKIIEQSKKQGWDG